MVNLCLILLASDGGIGRSSLVDVFSLPEWGASEAAVMARWPRLVPSPSVEGDDPNWRDQRVALRLLGVEMNVVHVFVAKGTGLRKVAFEFAQVLNEEEGVKRRVLFEAIEGLLGPPSLSGSCYVVWKHPDGQVLLERGQVTLLAPSESVLGADVGCYRLRPLPAVRRSGLGPVK